MQMGWALTAIYVAEKASMTVRLHGSVPGSSSAVGTRATMNRRRWFRYSRVCRRLVIGVGSPQPAIDNNRPLAVELTSIVGTGRLVRWRPGDHRSWEVPWSSLRLTTSQRYGGIRWSRASFLLKLIHWSLSFISYISYCCCCGKS